MLLLYLRNRATCGRAMNGDQAADPLLGDLLTIIDGLLRQYERQQTSVVNARELLRGLR